MSPTLRRRKGCCLVEHDNLNHFGCCYRILPGVFQKAPGIFLFSPPALRDSKEVFRIAKSDEPRINEEIRCATCRLIGVDGSQLGIFAIRDAQRVADDQGLDLVEISPNSEPPVCRVMN